MLDNMSASLLMDWISYFETEPFTFQLHKYGYGLIASAIYNTNRTKTSDKLWEPDDFFPKKLSEEDEIEQQVTIAKSIASMFSK